MKPQVARVAAYGFTKVFSACCDADIICVVVRFGSIGGIVGLCSNIIITEESVDAIVGNDYGEDFDLSYFADNHTYYLKWLDGLIHSRDECAKVVTELLPRPIAAKIAREMSIEYALI